MKNSQTKDRKLSTFDEFSIYKFYFVNKLGEKIKIDLNSNRTKQAIKLLNVDLD